VQVWQLSKEEHVWHFGLHFRQVKLGLWANKPLLQVSEHVPNSTFRYIGTPVVCYMHDVQKVFVFAHDLQGELQNQQLFILFL